MQYCRDKPALAPNAINDFTVANAITDGTKNVGVMVPLTYLSNFWRTLEMSLISCEVNLDQNLL